MYVHVASDRSWSTWAPTRPYPKSGWKRGRNPCPYDFLVTAITWLKTVTFYHADIPWPLLMARFVVLTRTHALILSARDTKPKNWFCPRAHNLPVRESTNTLFPFILHHLSSVILAKSDSSGTVIQRLLRNRPGSGRWHLSWFFARKITKCTNSCKPASLNCPM